MPPNPFILVTPATRGLSLALTRHYLRTTDLPVFATHRSNSEKEVKEHILSPLKDIDESRLKLLSLDLTSEKSISKAANTLSKILPEESYIHTAFLTGGVLHPEKQPADLDLDDINATFQINVISHLLLIKHFSQFLPLSPSDHDLTTPSKWVHVSARVGSIEDNKRGGWYSYRASKAALNQAVKTFDLHLQMKKSPAICVAVHPGTMKTDLSKGFWESTKNVLEPEEAAEKLAGVVGGLDVKQRGQVWDWAGKRVPW